MKRGIAEFEWLRALAVVAVVAIHVLTGISGNASVADVGVARAAL